MTLTWGSLLDEVAVSLRAAGIEDATGDARRIVAEASGHGEAALLVHRDEQPSIRAVAHVDDMVARRTMGEPLQYVVGRWGFRGLDLFVDRRVLIPRPETEQLVERALVEFDRIDARRVVDLGTGSGAIALSIATERVTSEVWASDASADALAVARANLAGIGRSGARVRLVEGSWFEALPDDLVGSVDLIVSNPPYVANDDPLDPVVADWEPIGALRAGPDGRRDLDVIVADAPRWLTAGGVLAVELDPRQAEGVAEHMRSVGFSAIDVYRDLAGRERIVIGRND